jgi:quercetin dioxygenase-like cupin family protein
MIVIDHTKQELAVWRPGNKTRLNIGAANGATRLCINEQWFEPGTGAPRHTHFDIEEAITVLEGRAEFWIDDDRAVVTQQMTVILPPYSHHGFTNVGDDTLHICAAFSAASVRTEYDEDPTETYAIGGTDGERVDAARVKQNRH